ncbi:MAG: hypothetical protein OEQ39_03325 [Gammaproteobacteria bacterium]|nr:hypothetical protein [Gammaproteobacteria bacterium]
MNLLDEAIELFGSTARPEHFTNFTHCCECAEHDETLRKHTIETLSYDCVRPGWDPLCFISPEGFQYYFPALVRLALEGTGDSYFIDQLIFHLELDGKRNTRYLKFTPEQRSYVVKLLNYLVETRADEVEENLDSDALLRTIEIWRE